MVINSCDLATKSAFRFGNRKSSCYRHGTLQRNDQVNVAFAVAASAAFPPLLPALDCNMKFTHQNTGDRSHRVTLTDGGIYDNLGISCFEPGRDNSYTPFTFDLDFLISCDAGHGMSPGGAFPYWWPSRMGSAFGAVFKKGTDYSRKLLNGLHGPALKGGYIHAYLGLQDHKLENKPADFVTRFQVNNYPTNFAAMSDQNIQLLTKRGEQIMEILMDTYGSNLKSYHGNNF